MGDTIHKTIDHHGAEGLSRHNQHQQHGQIIDDTLLKHAETHREMSGKIENANLYFEKQLAKLQSELIKQDEGMHKEINERVDGVERHNAGVSKETSKRLNALD